MNDIEKWKQELTLATTKPKRKELASEMANGGFCTHYAGYTCDKDFPDACPKCIEGWISRTKTNTQGMG
jgi:hypothetical protein